MSGPSGGKGASVLVCGGRRYDDRKAVGGVLSKLRDDRGVACIIQGGATGADYLAKQWGRREGVPVIEIEAQWQRYGKRAGHLRNGWMLDLCKPDLVIAFPGGPGTLNMLTHAAEAEVEVFIPIPFGDGRA